MSKCLAKAANDEANDRIKAFAQRTPGVTFIDPRPFVQDKTGKPDQQLFEPDDQTHLNKEGDERLEECIEDAGLAPHHAHLHQMHKPKKKLTP